MKQYDAIVVGAGIGGLASALLLAESGKKVALFEKTARTGGRLGSSARDGFTVASSSPRCGPSRARVARTSSSRTT